MSDLLETVLRDTFQMRANQLDPAAARRLMAVDYHPRRSRIPVFPVLGAAGLAAATAALVFVFTLGSTPAPAFAGWRSTPTPARPSQTASALAHCRLGRPVLTDTRGPYTAAVYAKPQGVGTCLEGPAVFSSSLASMQPALHGAIQVFEQTTSSKGVAATMLDGRVASGVTGVSINLSNGRSVKATVSHGWYLAWWPGKPHATTARIIRDTGTHTVALPASARVGAGSCGGGPVATSCASVGPGSSVGG